MNAARIKKLWRLATAARKHSHSPYSKFAVGAAFACGPKNYAGTNIENACFPAGACAERIALWTAVAEGTRRFDALVVVTPGGVPPCGMCLQALTEFCDPEMPIWLASPKKIGDAALKLRELLPHAYTKRELKASDL